MRTTDYFEHDADIGIIGRGKTLEEAFVAAAASMFAIMAEELEAPLDEHVVFEFEEEDIEYAFIEWLNLLLAHAHSRSIVLGRFTLRREKSRWHGEAWGRAWDEKVVRGVEVKGATLTMLSVERTVLGWEARCVVDV